MAREVWEWQTGESDGYNSVAALECTFINFGIMKMDDTCDSDSCRDFAKKYTARYTISLRVKIKTLEETIESMQEEFNALREEMRSRIDMIATVVSNTVDEVDDLRSTVQEYDFQSDIDSLGGQIDDLTSDVSDVVDRVSELETDVAANTDEIKDINNNLADRVLLE